MSGNRFTQVGRAADARVPAAAARVNLAGKTVMPTIIDTHTHLSETRSMLIDNLKRRAQGHNLAKMNAAGVRIVLGTDGSTPYAPHIEMEDMAVSRHGKSAPLSISS